MEAHWKVSSLLTLTDQVDNNNTTIIKNEAKKSNSQTLFLADCPLFGLCLSMYSNDLKEDKDNMNNDDYRKNEYNSFRLNVSGGGGSSRTGIPNCLYTYDLEISKESESSVLIIYKYTIDFGKETLMKVEQHPLKSNILLGCTDSGFSIIDLKNKIIAKWDSQPILEKMKCDLDDSYFASATFSADGKVIVGIHTSGFFLCTDTPKLCFSEKEISTELKLVKRSFGENELKEICRFNNRFDCDEKKFIVLSRSNTLFIVDLNKETRNIDRLEKFGSTVKLSNTINDQYKYTTVAVLDDNDSSFSYILCGLLDSSRVSHFQLFTLDSKNDDIVYGHGIECSKENAITCIEIHNKFNTGSVVFFSFGLSDGSIGFGHFDGEYGKMTQNSKIIIDKINPVHKFSVTCIREVSPHIIGKKGGSDNMQRIVSISADSSCKMTLLRKDSILDKIISNRIIWKIIFVIFFIIVLLF